MRRGRTCSGRSNPGAVSILRPVANEVAPGSGSCGCWPRRLDSVPGDKQAFHGLPKAISGINSYWVRGYGDPPPRTLIVVGLSRDFLERNFESCVLAGHVTNRYGVLNEETTRHPDLFVCRQLRQPWPAFWKQFRNYG